MAYAQNFYTPNIISGKVLVQFQPRKVVPRDKLRIVRQDMAENEAITSVELALHGLQC